MKPIGKIGKAIVEREQAGNIRAEYSKKLLLALSRQLSNEIGKGFSRSNLQNMRNFYLLFPKCQTASGILSWSHYCELLTISDKPTRDFYEAETANAKWSVKELRRQISTSLFERLLLSQGEDKQQYLLQLAREGQQIQQASDLIKNPYVFEFLGVPENKPLRELDLQLKIIRYIENFLLEMGKGFMFVGTQQRITLDNTHYYVDMVFYNKILRSYILIDLKTVKLDHTHVGQMNMYLNYYKTEINDELDQDPIGIILCTDRNEPMAEYALGGLSNQIFAAKYVLYVPDKETLIQQLKKMLNHDI